jgi:8-oxo-dGTP pyrophosphatase MutT (NUDIX family)
MSSDVSPSGAAAPGRGAQRSEPSRRSAGEVSAGGVVVRGDQLVVIVPTRRAPDGSKVLGLPKGHIDPGESALQAARREVFEEAGVEGEPIGSLGETRYEYRLGPRLISKVVSFYLFRYVGGDPADHDHEVEEARWMGLAEAEQTLTHVGEREIVALARAHLEENATQDR